MHKIAEVRFAFAVNNFPPRVGGVETHVHSLVVALQSAGHTAVVITVGGGPVGTHIEEGVRVIRLPERFRVGDVLGFPPLGTTRRLRRLLAEERVDVVSVHTRFFPMTWIGLRAASKASVPVVHTEHGSGHVVSSSPVITLASRLVDRTIGRFVLRRADEVVGVSESVVGFVQRLSGRRARVFYNAIEPASTDGRRHGDKSHVVFVGRLVPGKGAEDFVDTVAALRRRGIDVAATMLGDGPERASIRSRIDRHGLAEVVEMRGRVPASAVRSTLAGAVLVNPTVLAEGFQTTLLEALAERGSIVTYEVPGAGVLREQGHPVVIVQQHDPEALASAVSEMLAQEWPVTALDGWYWKDRAEEYERIVEGVKR